MVTASLVTSAFLFAACTTENNRSSQDQAAPTSAPSAAQPAAAQAAPSAQASPIRVALAAPTAAAQASAVSPNPAVTVYQQNGAKVVNITSIALVQSRQGQTALPQGIGSGFMIDNDGRIVTNNHVVQDADQLTVTLQDKSTVPAKLLGRDPDNDLAVIQVDPNDQDDQGRAIRDRISPVTMANSDQVVIGDTAVAIGSPLGLQATVTEGIVSARREPGEASQLPGQQLDLLGGAIQTDAAINPGNSGGPLFNAAGQVIGVNSAILSQSGGNEGIGFAIPTNVVMRVVPELIQTGQYRHPFLGVTTIPLAQIGQGARQQLGISTNLKGLLVVDVSDGAQQAGLQAGNRQVNIGGQQVPAGGDIITAIDGNPVSTGGDLRAYIENNKHPGDTVTVTVLRNGQRVDIPVTLGERPPEQQPQQRGR
jgi:S1-C subfamily serine protease